jgi:hypothetical protein
MQFGPRLESLAAGHEFVVARRKLPDSIGLCSGLSLERHQFTVFGRALKIEHPSDRGNHATIGGMGRDVIDKRAIEINLAAIAQARNMLFATFDHHIPRSASLIESSGASEDEAISITKHPARELALMNAIGLLPALMDSRMSKPISTGMVIA